MKLSFTTLGCPAWTVEQIATNAAQMGYDGVDFRGVLDQIEATPTTMQVRGKDGVAEPSQPTRSILLRTVRIVE